jgi:hypothetical protein
VVARIPQHAGTLRVDVRVPRNLVVTSESFDKVSHGYLPDPTIEDGFFLGPNFHNIAARYWLYLTTEKEVVVRPDESDFVTYQDALELIPPSQLGTAGPPLSIRVPPASIALAPSPPYSVMLTAELGVASREGAQLLPRQLYLCVRAENYLGTLSSFDFTPVAITIVD